MALKALGCRSVVQINLIHDGVHLGVLVNTWVNRKDVTSRISYPLSVIMSLNQVFNTFDVRFFQFMHCCYLAGMQPQMLLQHSCPLFQLTNIDTKTEAVLTFLVYVHSDFLLTLYIEPSASVKTGVFLTNRATVNSSGRTLIRDF